MNIISILKTGRTMTSIKYDSFKHMNTIIIIIIKLFILTTLIIIIIIIIIIAAIILEFHFAQAED
jgi:hypothetical protein